MRRSSKPTLNFVVVGYPTFNVTNGLKIAGFSPRQGGKSTTILGGVTNRPYKLNKMLGRGAQGSVYEDNSNTNRVIKVRKWRHNNYSQEPRNNAFHKYYLSKLREMKNNKSVNIDKKTKTLMNKYPDHFLEALLQHKASKANIGAKVYEISATEHRNTNNKLIVHIYIVMDKLQNTNSTINERTLLTSQAEKHGIIYQNGPKSWTPKANHVMQTKNGRKVLLNFGNSSLLMPSDINSPDIRYLIDALEVTDLR